MDTDLKRLLVLAGVKPKNDLELKKVGTTNIFDAGNVDEMRDLLARYKAASGDSSPSHVFELGGQLWVATAVIGLDRSPDNL